MWIEMTRRWNISKYESADLDIFRSRTNDFFNTMSGIAFDDHMHQTQVSELRDIF
jgi:hypothetical protein